MPRRRFLPGPSFEPLDLGVKLLQYQDMRDASTLFYDNNRTILASVGGPVGGITDLSGHTMHEINVSGDDDHKPIRRTAGINGHPAIEWVGNGWLMSNGAPTNGLQQFEIWLVASATAAGTQCLCSTNAGINSQRIDMYRTGSSRIGQVLGTNDSTNLCQQEKIDASLNANVIRMVVDTTLPSAACKMYYDRIGLGQTYLVDANLAGIAMTNGRINIGGNSSSFVEFPQIGFTGMLAATLPLTDPEAASMTAFMGAAFGLF